MATSVERRLRGSDSAASYLSGLDELRQETSLAFGDDPDRSSSNVGDEAYNVDFYNVEQLFTLWGNHEFVEYWGSKAVTDLGMLDDILEHFARTQRQPEQLSSSTAEDSKGTLFDATDFADPEE